MKNEKKISCLNCQHSYRGGDGVLYCHKRRTTTVTQSYDCAEYQAFIENKEDLIQVLKTAIYEVKHG